MNKSSLALGRVRQDMAAGLCGSGRSAIRVGPRPAGGGSQWSRIPVHSVITGTMARSGSMTRAIRFPANLQSHQVRCDRRCRRAVSPDCLRRWRVRSAGPTTATPAPCCTATPWYFRHHSGSRARDPPATGSAGTSTRPTTANGNAPRLPGRESPRPGRSPRSGRGPSSAVAIGIRCARRFFHPLLAPVSEQQCHQQTPAFTHSGRECGLSLPSFAIHSVRLVLACSRSPLRSTSPLIGRDRYTSRTMTECKAEGIHAQTNHQKNVRRNTPGNIRNNRSQPSSLGP